MAFENLIQFGMADNRDAIAPKELIGADEAFEGRELLDPLENLKQEDLVGKLSDKTSNKYKSATEYWQYCQAFIDDEQQVIEQRDEDATEDIVRLMDDSDLHVRLGGSLGDASAPVINLLDILNNRRKQLRNLGLVLLEPFELLDQTCAVRFGLSLRDKLEDGRIDAYTTPINHVPDYFHDFEQEEHGILIRKQSEDKEFDHQFEYGELIYPDFGIGTIRPMAKFAVSFALREVHVIGSVDENEPALRATDTIPLTELVSSN